MPNEKPLNIHEKILKIADMAGVLRKDKDGFNYKYVPELEIQAKVTAGMQKYKVGLLPSLVPGTLEVIPWKYDKPKTKVVKDDNGKNKTVDYTIPVNEVIVKSEVKYTWVNVENPSETIDCYWAYIGQMEDASQAFGAGATYGNRYYLLKALQLATTEDDPDSYRGKQKQAEQFEEEKAKKEAAEALAKAKKEIVEYGTKLIAGGATKDEVSKMVAKHNGDNKNPNSIQSVEICEKIKAEFEKYEKTPKPAPESQTKATKKKGE